MSSKLPNPAPFVELVNAAELDSNYFFQLSLSPKYLPEIAVIAGDPGNLLELTDIHEFSQAWHWSMQFYSSQRTCQFVPASIVAPLISKKSGKGLNSLAEATVGLVGYGIHIGSTEQVLLEGLLAETDNLTCVTAECINLLVSVPKLRQKSQILPVFSVADYVSYVNKTHTPVKIAPQRGIHNVAALLAAAPLASRIKLAFDAERVYIYVTESNHMLHIVRDPKLSQQRVRTYLSLLTVGLLGHRRTLQDLTVVCRAILYLSQACVAGQPVQTVAVNVRDRAEAAAS